MIGRLIPHYFLFHCKDVEHLGGSSDISLFNAFGKVLITAYILCARKQVRVFNGLL